MAKILIVEARCYEHYNDLLIAGAKAVIEAAGHEAEVLTVPGALEVPGAIALAAQDGQTCTRGAGRSATPLPQRNCG